MEWGTVSDWFMVIITLAYAVVTTFIYLANNKSVKAQQKALEESKRQFEESLQLQKQHDYASVIPAVSINFSSSDDKKPFCGEIKIVNNGLGPAIIKKLGFFKDGEVINPNGFCTFYDLICIRLKQEGIQISTEKIKDIFRIYSKEFRDSEDDRDYLGVGKSLTLLSFCARSDREEEIVGRIFCGVEMELVYTNLYYISDKPSLSHTENKESTRTEDPFERTVKKRLSYFKPNWIAFHPNTKKEFLS